MQMYVVLSIQHPIVIRGTFYYLLMLIVEKHGYIFWQRRKKLYILLNAFRIALRRKLKCLLSAYKVIEEDNSIQMSSVTFASTMGLRGN